MNMNDLDQRSQEDVVLLALNHPHDVAEAIMTSVRQTPSRVIKTKANAHNLLNVVDICRFNDLSLALNFTNGTLTDRVVGLFKTGASHLEMAIASPFCADDCLAPDEVDSVVIKSIGEIFLEADLIAYCAAANMRSVDGVCSYTIEEEDGIYTVEVINPFIGLEVPSFSIPLKSGVTTTPYDFPVLEVSLTGNINVSKVVSTASVQITYNDVASTNLTYQYAKSMTVADSSLTIEAMGLDHGIADALCLSIYDVSTSPARIRITAISGTSQQTVALLELSGDETIDSARVCVYQTLPQTLGRLRATVATFLIEAFEDDWTTPLAITFKYALSKVIFQTQQETIYVV